MKCELCNKEVSKLKELFGKKVCKKCIKNYEEASDVSDLSFIIERRGIEWIKKQINIK